MIKICKICEQEFRFDKHSICRNCAYIKYYKSRPKTIKICKDCNIEFLSNKEGVCSPCRKIKYSMKDRTPYTSNNLFSKQYCFKWVEDRIKDNYNITQFELMRMIGIYESLGGKICWNDYDVSKQLTNIWEYIFKKYNNRIIINNPIREFLSIKVKEFLKEEKRKKYQKEYQKEYRVKNREFINNYQREYNDKKRLLKNNI